MRLLFITSTRIGDAVLSTGLLGHLLERHPGARVTIACGPISAPLFAAVPGLERIIVVKKQRYNLHWLKLWAQLVTHRWDLVVDLRASITGLLVPRAKRVTFWRKEDDTHRVPELGKLLGLDPPPAPRVWLARKHEALAQRRLPGTAPVLAIGPAANWTAKQWPAERFADLAARLTAPAGLLPGAKVAVLAAGHERAQAQPVIDSLGPERVIDLVGALDLLEAAACISRASLFIGNDSGLMHLAAATGTPTLGLFGPTPEDRYAPWGDHCAVVRTAESYDTLRALPDFEARADAGRLMDGLSVEAVAEAAEALWQRVTPQTAAAERHG